MSYFKTKIVINTIKPLFGRKEADPMMKDIAEKLDLESKKNIRNQITPDNNPFQPLSERTIKNKRSKGSISPSKALIDKGIMLRSIRAKRLGVAKYEIGVAGRGIPKRDEVSDYHHTGGGNLPARPFLGISSKSLEWIDKRVARWIEGQLSKAKRELRLINKNITAIGGGLF